MHTRINRVFNNLFKDNNWGKSFEDFKYELNSHPDFPTLKSIADTLEKFGIENAPVRLDSNELKQVDTPFLAYLKNKRQNELCYVKPSSKSELTYVGETINQERDSQESFERKFTGIAVLLDIKEAKLPVKSIRKWQEDQLLKTIISLAFISFLGLLINGSYTSGIQLNSVTDWLYIICSFLGLTLSAILVSKDLGVSNNLTEKVCRVGKKADCNSVLESPFATIYGSIKWSDLGLVYFSAQILLISYNQINLSCTLSLLASSYVLLSLYQQLFVIKKLCPICLGVLATLVIQLILSIISFSTIEIRLIEPLYLAPLIVMISVLYLMIKYFFLSAKEKEKQELKYNRLKRIPEVISTVVQRENQLIIPNIPLQSLTFCHKGEKPLNIQVFLSLQCGHCKRQFNQLDIFYKENANVSFQLFLDFDPRNATYVDFLEQVLTVYNADPEKAWKNLRSWYNEASNNKYQKLKEEPSEELKLLYFTTRKLMQQNQIAGLPKLYIEGLEKSNHYNLQDYINNLDTIKAITTQDQKEMIINT